MNKKGLVADWFDLFAMMIMVFLTLTLIYVGLISAANDRDDLSVFQRNTVTAVNDAITSERAVFYDSVPEARPIVVEEGDVG
ncbi:hypothetical protein COV20_04815 [Candidatus Woesearchaeota archaeon CG10_big_fil_rev_8_21_14_0_10_45_16]|nr:MAG: hypothetical protein COV20_04815 [Candidatus Woesearchaeota archaeon CG10_big_fil_rev_8_21_14_0_10_45_16]